MKLINLNDEVTFKVTSYGANILNDYYSRNPFNTREYNANDKVSLPLWEFANLFGHTFFNGGPLSILDNELIVKSIVYSDDDYLLNLIKEKEINVMSFIEQNIRLENKMTYKDYCDLQLNIILSVKRLEENEFDKLMTWLRGE